MHNFIILDDDTNHNNNTKKRLEAIFIKHDFKASIALNTTDPNEGIKYCLKKDSTKSIPNNTPNNVYLLDVNVQSIITGIDVASIIRKQDAKAYIVFISAHPEYVMPSLKTKVFDYLIKPVSIEILESCIISIFKDFTKLNIEEIQTLSIKSGGNVYHLILGEIIYFEKFGHLLVVHTCTGRIESSESLDKIEQKLDKMKFFRCHKSYIVNLSYISRIDYPNNIIYLKNGEECLVSKRCKKELKSICNQI